jgi:hypothetical protein
MAICYACGNEYDRPIEVTLGGERYDFDCFECAIHALAPACAHCGCRIIGHGVEANDTIYCCANCAQPAAGPRSNDAGCEP